jgi:hypothetical protein
MKEKELHVLLEVQYLKGRLDELQYKAVPNTYSLEGSRILDQRVHKYYDKLKKTSELAYHLHCVERANLLESKRKSQGNIKQLLIDIKSQIIDPKYIEIINNQIKRYE